MKVCEEMHTYIQTNARNPRSIQNDLYETLFCYPPHRLPNLYAFLTEKTCTESSGCKFSATAVLANSFNFNKK